MRRALAAAVVAAAAFAVPGTATAYDCGGIVDVQCYGRYCSMDCFGGDCLLWVDARHDPHSAVCVSDVTQ